MAAPPRYGPPDGDADARAYAGIAGQAFAGDAATFEGWLRGFGDDVRVLRERDVQAGMVFYSMGQYFGGRAVDTWGVAGVAVRPELRLRGLGRELMLAHLREHFDSGPPISTLYPAAPRMYRNLGWEYAGSRISYVARVSELPAHETTLVVRAAGDADARLIEGLYERRTAPENGCLRRSEAIWKRVRRTPEGSPFFAYVAERDGVPEGYALYTQKRDGTTPRFDILVRDLVCVTTEGARAFIGFFARHQSVANQMFFFGAPHDPMLLELQRGPEVRVHERQDWMLRIVRVKDALEARGYAAYVSAEAVIRVRDETLPANDGSWKLTLRDGQMTVSKGGKGGPGIDARGLAALYSGSMTTTQLRSAGLMDGSGKHDAALGAMFAGPPSWMPDYF